MTAKEVVFFKTMFLIGVLILPQNVILCSNQSMIPGHVVFSAIYADKAA